MKMKTLAVILLTLFVVLGLILVERNSASSEGSLAPQPATQVAQLASSPGAAPAEDVAQTDQQGAVTVTIKPLNLDNPTETLDFEVSMNTHSVELNMDLAALATLTTDIGLTVKASAWKSPGGGHHVSGTLSFPASVDGSFLLKGSAYLKLTLRNVDAPERTFRWNLTK